MSGGWKCTATTPSVLIKKSAYPDKALKTILRRLFLFLTTLCAFSLSSPTLAQDLGWAFTIAWSPDGDTLAIGSSSGLWFFDDTLNEVGFVAIPQFKGFAPTTMDWSADGSLIALANRVFPHSSPSGRVRGDDFPILIVDAVKREVSNVIHFPRPSAPIEWHPRDRRILVGHSGGRATILNAITGEAEYSFYAKTATAVCWADESTIAIIGWSDISVVDILRNRVTHRIEPGRHFSGVVEMPASCDRSGRALHGYAYSFDLLAGTRERIYSLDNTITLSDYWYEEWHGVAIAYSPDGKKIATNGNSGRCRIAVFNGESHNLITELQGSYVQGNDDQFRDSIAWHPAGEKLAIVGQFDIRIWDAETYELLQRFEGFNTGHYDPQQKEVEEGDSESLFQKRLRLIRCPDIPDSMLFKQQ